MRSPGRVKISGLIVKSLFQSSLNWFLCTMKDTDEVPILLDVEIEFAQCRLLQRLSSPHGNFMIPLSKFRWL